MSSMCVSEVSWLPGAGRGTGRSAMMRLRKYPIWSFPL